MYLTDDEGSVLGIHAVSVTRPLRDKQALLFVVAKCTPADARTLGQLPDQQPAILPLTMFDLNADVTPYGHML